ncbi:unnamed protein product [Penicillium glandicola]
MFSNIVSLHRDEHTAETLSKGGMRLKVTGSLLDAKLEIENEPEETEDWGSEPNNDENLEDVEPTMAMAAAWLMVHQKAKNV